MRDRTARLLATSLVLAVSFAADPAAAQNLGERIGGALNRSAKAVGKAAERAGSATGAAADRGVTWAQRKVRGERTGHERQRERDDRQTGQC
jgi:hypothetical protein